MLSFQILHCLHVKRQDYKMTITNFPISSYNSLFSSWLILLYMTYLTFLWPTSSTRKKEKKNLKILSLSIVCHLDRTYNVMEWNIDFVSLAYYNCHRFLYARTLNVVSHSDHYCEHRICDENTSHWSLGNHQTFMLPAELFLLLLCGIGEANYVAGVSQGIINCSVIRQNMGWSPLPTIWRTPTS